MSGDLAALQTLFDTAVFRRAGADHFRLLNEPPGWLSRQLPAARSDGATIALRGWMFFLDNFLDEAAGLWQARGATRLRSEPWQEAGQQAEGIVLRATAVCCGEDDLLLLERPDDGYAWQVATLQQARGAALQRERLEQEVERRTAQIRRREEELAIRLLAAAGARDEETGEHVRRIGLYSAAMARGLGWSERNANEIQVAAPMHDLGKIGIPDRILRKPGRLDNEELAIMRTHTSIGAQMLAGSDIAMLQMAREIALAHHEHWSGGGYPSGLRGDAIPLAARIVAIVDVYDALVHKRVYKRAFAEDESLAIVRAGSGEQLDPLLIELFFDLLAEMRDIRERIREPVALA